MPQGIQNNQKGIKNYELASQQIYIIPTWTFYRDASRYRANQCHANYNALRLADLSSPRYAFFC